ncbi:hypothetical protein [Nocardia transvalensis]|uniref:hypothetical protein n=1 Tax=Nocardia transvalensis TaxID=37333 RepID=UPI0018933873|nr:hypothetical protein [Nocardia transvalensis]MBF6330533.1 hypothetical protein [Nocardia transvalensis]
MAAQHSTSSGQWLRRTGSLLVIGAVPVAFALSEAAPAAADTTDPAAVADRNDLTVPRPVPTGPLAPIDPAALHPPVPAPAVAPIQAPDNTIRIGSAMTDRPDWLDPQQAAQLNDAAATTEASLAQGLDSVGFAPSRSDRIAADTLAGAATGAIAAAALTSPIAATGAVIGTVAGLVAGLPFAPAGLVVLTPLGAAAGAATITVPSAAIGAALGAAAGATQGALAPPTP